MEEAPDGGAWYEAGTAHAASVQSPHDSGKAAPPSPTIPASFTIFLISSLERKKDV